MECPTHCHYVQRTETGERQLCGWGEVLSTVYLVDGDVPFFRTRIRVTFSPIFPRAWYQSKDVFLELVVKKGTFSVEQASISAILGFIFTVLSICPNLLNFLVDFAAIC